MSRIRQILPGLIYEYPPHENKTNPLNSTKEDFFKKLEEANKISPVLNSFISTILD